MRPFSLPKCEFTNSSVRSNRSSTASRKTSSFVSTRAISALTDATSLSTLTLSARTCAISDLSRRTSPCRRLICSPRNRRSTSSATVCSTQFIDLLRYHRGRLSETSQIQHQPRRILQQLFHPHQEGDGF